MLSPSGCDAFFADLATCADDAGLLGGKAASLRRLAAAGLATPPAFVITHALSEALTATLKTAGGSDADNQALARAFATAPFPPGFDAALAARLAALGSHRFSVRSSFAHEDRAGEVAAGIYDSVIDVPAAEVGMALRRVLASAVSAGATAYAHARGFASTSAPLAILIHPFLAGVTHGAAAAADETSEVVVDVVAGSLSAQARAAIETAIRRLAARHGASEVEWVDLGARVVFLQLRPYQTQAPRAAWAGFADLPAGTTADEWTWDAAHNPLPLSAAHAGLVAWVDQRCRIGIRQCVLGGYLFWRPDATNQRPAATPATLHARYAAIAEAIDSDLATLAHAPALDDALTIFTRHYQPLLGELPPAANARAALHRFLAEHAAVFPDLDATLASLLTDVESEKTERQRRADAVATAADDNARQAALTAYLARFGDEALAWDLAAPTAREQPARFFPATKRSRPDTHRETTTTGPDAVTRLSERLAPADRSTFLALVAQARTAVAVGENDDWLYARLQAPVRHAITALAHRFVGKGLTAVEDAFLLSL
ncbi:MAG TPA: PEP/pyruvate-binding domain-containing protein, partial [Polyangia bacterium]